ncbi:MAG: hypothetical protein FWB71_04465 [Defluviitaleaceae bacterium]|nr:hypothetical protein [Defluviitaleaceae bacterium]
MRKINYKKIRQQFLRNLPWKLGAFVLASLLWFAIMNIVDPIRTILVPLDLELRNEAALTGGALEIILENRAALVGQTISVQVRGNSRRIEELRSGWRAYIDLAAADIIFGAYRADTLFAAVQIEGNFDDIQEMARQPALLPLSLDTMITQQFEIEVDFIGDQHIDFFIPTGSIERNPRFIMVTGPSSMVSRIDRLAVSVDITGRTTPLSTTANPIPLDIRGELVTGPGLRIDGVAGVFVPIHRRGMAHISRPTFDGMPPPGFRITNIDWSPRELDIAGADSEAVLGLMPIHLSPIPEGDVSSQTANFQHTWNITHYLPAGVYLIEGHRQLITADITVEPEAEREFTLAISDISLLGLMPNIAILTDEITVRLRAVERLIMALTGIIATADLSGLDEGEHIVPVVLVLDEDFVNVGELPFIEIIVLPIIEEYDEYE